MALKPTIYKLKIALADLNREIYDNLNLTLALHPSETMERMMARVLAFCLNAEEQLAFTKGLSSGEEPDLWCRTLDDQLALWIDVGEPATDRIKKASRLADSVKVYSFNSKSNVWWKQNQSQFSKLSASIFRFNWEEIQHLATLAQRTMELSVTITDASAYFSTDQSGCEVSWEILQ